MPVPLNPFKVILIITWSLSFLLIPSLSAVEKVTLLILTRESIPSHPEYVLFNKLKEEFTAKYPHVQFQDDSVQNEAAFISKYKTMFATGNVYDFMNIDGGASLQQYADAGIFMNVEPILQEDPEFAKGFNRIDFTKWQYPNLKGIYGIPHFKAAETLFYHPHLFEKIGLEGPPQTWNEFIEAIKKFRAIGITPMTMSTKSNWRAGHLHNALFYKWLGVHKSMALAQRKAKWNDPDVVQTFQFLKDLKDMGAFPKHFSSMGPQQEIAMFLNGEAAMMWNGPWVVSHIESANLETKVKVALFPSFEEKPEFFNHGVVYIGGFQLNGKARGAQREWGIKFAKFVLGKAAQERFYLLGQSPARNDLVVNRNQLSPLIFDIHRLGLQVKYPGGDTYDFDKNPTMQNRTRDSIQGMLVAGMTPQEAADEIQNEIDNE